jgi:putative two-component system response regulator
MEDRILIVDDEPTICSLIDRRLTREGYSCVTANNGKEALDLFLKKSFSLVLSDIRMPEMDGIELLKTIRALSPKMMMVMVTGYPEINMAVEALRLGAYDFILKPADLELVVHSVKKALGKKKLEEEVEAYQVNLEQLVEERTAKLQQAYNTLKKAHLDSVKVLAEAIDAKDPYTRGHSDRVRRMTLALAGHLGFAKDRLESLELGALLHDIGKIGIKDEILQKHESFTPEEYQYIQEHTLMGVKIVEGIDFFKNKLSMIRHHHEHFDGSGYPDGLVGEAIPLEARIIAITDAFDAMTSTRPHHGPFPLEDVLQEMEKCKGKQFDPEILEIFLSKRIYDSSKTTQFAGHVERCGSSLNEEKQFQFQTFSLTPGDGG